MNLIHKISIICLSVILTWPMVLLGHSTQKNLKISFEKRTQMLSVQAKNIFLSKVLKEIEKESGCQISLFSEKDDRIFVTFFKQPIQEGVQRLAKGYSMAVIYKKIDSSENTKKRLEVSQIWLFDGKASILSQLPNPASKNVGKFKRKRSEKREIIDDVDREKSRISARQISPNLYQVLKIEQFDDETSFGYWANQLFGSSNNETKKQAIAQLRDIGSDEALLAITAVMSDKNGAIRKYAIENIKQMENDGVLQIIGQTLLGDKNSDVRKSALDYFARRQDPVSQAFLNSALKDSDEEIRTLAQKALDQL